jgi:hypothetical protein
MGDLKGAGRVGEQCSIAEASNRTKRLLCNRHEMEWLKAVAQRDSSACHNSAARSPNSR